MSINLDIKNWRSSILIFGIIVLAIVVGFLAKDQKKSYFRESKIRELVTLANNQLPIVSPGIGTIDSVTYDKETSCLVYHSTTNAPYEAYVVLENYGFNQQEQMTDGAVLNNIAFPHFKDFLLLLKDLNLDITYKIKASDNKYENIHISVDQILQETESYKRSPAELFAKLLNQEYEEINILRQRGLASDNLTSDFFDFFYDNSSDDNQNGYIYADNDTVVFVSIKEIPIENIVETYRTFKEIGTEAMSKIALSHYVKSRGKEIVFQLKYYSDLNINFNFKYIDRNTIISDNDERKSEIIHEYEIKITHDMLKNAYLNSIIPIQLNYN